MATKKARPARRKVGQKKPLSARIVQKVQDEQRVTPGAMPSVPKDLTRGPIGNLDYVAHGSPEHAVLEGFSDETMTDHRLDIQPIKPEIKVLIIESHRRAATGVPSAPPGTPPRYTLEPDNNVAVE